MPLMPSRHTPIYGAGDEREHSFQARIEIMEVESR
jgi:hypothetical protein